MRVRIKFEKHGPVKFTGHLDTMRCFQKALVRAGIDVCYSEGFSPHQKISFALPLAVGMESSGEYFDAEVNALPDEGGILNLLNNQMAPGFKVAGCVKLNDGAQKCMAAVCAADYKIRLSGELARMNQDFIDSFLDRTEILSVRKTKNSESVENIRPLIETAAADNGILTVRIAAGSLRHLKPQRLVEAISDMAGVKDFGASYERLEMYARCEDESGCRLMPLDCFGVDIV